MHDGIHFSLKYFWIWIKIWHLWFSRKDWRNKNSRQVVSGNYCDTSSAKLFKMIWSWSIDPMSHMLWSCAMLNSWRTMLRLVFCSSFFSEFSHFISFFHFLVAHSSLVQPTRFSCRQTAAAHENQLCSTLRLLTSDVWPGAPVRRRMERWGKPERNQTFLSHVLFTSTAVDPVTLARCWLSGSSEVGHQKDRRRTRAVGGPALSPSPPPPTTPPEWLALLDFTSVQQSPSMDHCTLPPEYY